MKWEYHVASISVYSLRCEILNKLGAQGWELVGVHEHEFYFKRKSSGMS